MTLFYLELMCKRHFFVFKDIYATNIKSRFKSGSQIVDKPRLFKKVKMLGAPEERAAPRTVGRTQASALRSNDADWPF
jgi:hypothetical protein